MLVGLNGRHEAKSPLLAANNFIHFALNVPESVEHLALALENLTQLPLAVRFEPLFWIAILRLGSIRVGLSVTFIQKN